MEQSDEAKASTEERNQPTAYDTTTYKEGGSHINNWPVTKDCSDAESRAAEEKARGGKTGRPKALVPGAAEHLFTQTEED